MNELNYHVVKLFEPDMVKVELVASFVDSDSAFLYASTLRTQRPMHKPNMMVAIENPYSIMTVTTKALEALQGKTKQTPDIIFELVAPMYNTRTNMYERKVRIRNKDTGNCSIIGVFAMSATVPNELQKLTQEAEFKANVEDVLCNLTKSK